MIATFTIDGDPVGKGRHRTAVVRGRARQYTPPRTRAYETQVGWVARASLPRDWPLDADYRLTLDVYVRDRRVSRPDASNVQKAIEDGLNGIAWADDRQVRAWGGEMRIDKARPRVEVRIEVLS